MSFPSGSQMHRNSTPCNCMHLKGPLYYTSLWINTGSEFWQSMLCPSPPFEALVHMGVVWQHRQTPPPQLPFGCSVVEPSFGSWSSGCPKTPTCSEMDTAIRSWRCPSDSWPVGTQHSFPGFQDLYWLLNLVYSRLAFSLVIKMYFSMLVKCIICVILYIKMYPFSQVKFSFFPFWMFNLLPVHYKVL